MKGCLLFILGVVAVAALPSTPQREYPRIVGGSLTNINQYPYGVSMLASSAGTVYSQTCGGTIINNRSVLTAAHCVWNMNQIWQWRARVGSTFANSGGIVYNTAQIIRHPQYNSNTEDNDFAIIRISGTLSWSNVVSPASIAGANYNLADNQPVWAIGWGRTAANGPASEQLRHVQVWTVNQSICVQRYGTMGLPVTNNMLCSGWLDVGGRDQCQGDSGGPLIHNGVIVGVCSWGLGCAESFFPGVNARVSAASNWIVSNA